MDAKGAGLRLDGGVGGRETFVVPRGERRYLVTRHSAQRFWNEARKGPDVSLGHLTLLREGDEALPVAGLPELPPQLAASVR